MRGRITPRAMPLTTFTPQRRRDRRRGRFGRPRARTMTPRAHRRSPPTALQRIDRSARPEHHRRIERSSSALPDDDASCQKTSVQGRRPRSASISRGGGALEQLAALLRLIAVVLQEDGPEDLDRRDAAAQRFRDEIPQPGWQQRERDEHRQRRTESQQLLHGQSPATTRGRRRPSANEAEPRARVSGRASTSVIYYRAR